MVHTVDKAIAVAAAAAGTAAMIAAACALAGHSRAHHVSKIESSPANARWESSPGSVAARRYARGDTVERSAGADVDELVSFRRTPPPGRSQGLWVSTETRFAMSVARMVGGCGLWWLLARRGSAVPQWVRRDAWVENNGGGNGRQQSKSERS